MVVKFALMHLPQSASSISSASLPRTVSDPASGILLGIPTLTVPNPLTKLPRMLRFVVLVATTALVFIWACTPKQKPMTDPPPPTPISTPHYGDYPDRWKRVDSLINQARLPKSALEEVQAIYTLAEQTANEPQLVKALVYRIGLEQQTEGELPEDAYFTKLQQAIDQQGSDAARALLQSILAGAYERYAQQQQWQIRQRTPLTSPRSERPVDTWTLEDLEAASNALFIRSTSYPATRNIAIKSFDALFSSPKRTEGLRPTLYDFLAARAVDHLLNSSTQLTEAVYAFRIDDPAAFGPVETFVDWSIATPDSTSARLGALRLLQDWLAFRSSQPNSDALIDADLKRLELVYQQYTGSDKEALYRDALRRVETRYSGNPLVARAIYQRAAVLYTEGQSWQPVAGEVDDSLRLKHRRAVALCRTAIKRFPDSEGAQRCEQLVITAKRPELALQVESVNVPETAFPALVSYRNVAAVHLRVIRMNETRRRTLRTMEQRRGNGRTAGIEFLAQLPAEQTHVYELPDKADFREHRVEVKVDALAPGQYLLLAGANAEMDTERGLVGYQFFSVSQLGAWNRGLFGDNVEVTVFDRETGHPIRGATVEFFTTQYNSAAREQVRQALRSTTTGVDGRAGIQSVDQRRIEYLVHHQQDTLDVGGSIYTGYRQGSRTTRETVFYLDRGIYRPGQTVYFKGILLESDTEERPRIRPRASTTVGIYDANGQLVEEQQLSSNEYGSIQGSFTAPADGLTGTMSLRADHGSINFRVEEYKRPKFSVEFEPVDESYRLNEEVKVTGSAQAYAGAPVDGAKVRYTVTREVRYPYWWYRTARPPGGAQQLAAGEATTDAQGNFTITFTALPEAGADLDKKPVYTYRINADVIDINGETRSANSTVRVGAVALEVMTDLPATLSVDSLRSFVIQTKNLNGEEVSRTGTLQIRELEPPKRVFKTRYWEAPDLYLLSQKSYKEHFPHLAYLDENEPRAWPAVRTVVEKDWESGKFLLSRRLSAGTYLLTVSTTDRYGTEVNHRQVVQLYDAAKDQLPAPQLAWTKVRQPNLQPGESLAIELATSLSDLPVLVEVSRDDELVRSEWVTAEQWATYRYPISEADRGGLTLQLSYAKLGRSFNEKHLISVPWKNKALDISYRSFRDKLSPGAKERWTLQIDGPQGDAAAAELLATLYDASLDAFAINQYAANYWPTRYSAYHFDWQAPGFGAQRVGTFRQPPVNASNTYPDVDRRYRGFAWYISQFGYGEPQLFRTNNFVVGARARTHPMREVEMPMMSADVVVESLASLPTKNVDALAGKAAGVVAEEVVEESDETSPASTASTAPPVRENLNETVFFFPQLRTDEQGRILIDFTMNEALTEWKFLGLAHTKDLQTATTERRVVTQKELMVLPNVPRFVREGDEVIFASKITNLTDQAMTGTATLQLTNPITEQAVYPWKDQAQFNKTFTAQPKASTVVEWRFKVPSVTEVPLLQHTILAEAGQYSDGERSVLPVLTNRMLVTETQPLPVAGNDRATFTFNSLLENNSKTLSHEGLTLELTSNPAWYAVQALPYLMEYPHECTEQVFSRYYANTLASSIANRHPKVKAIYEQWKRAGSDALVSNLSKNEALKSALLTETPWVMAARSETEQKQRIGLLFDLNRMAQEQRAALAKIRQRQQAGGGWPWMPGGRDNWYISQYLVEGLAHLRELGATDAWTESELDMLRKAVGYLDREAARVYRDLEDQVKAGNTTWEEDHLSPILLHYLYTRSYFLRKNNAQVNTGQGNASADRAYFPLDKAGQRIYDYYTMQAEQYWNTRNLMSQAMITLCLHRLDRPTEVQALLQSFRERALHDDELGMYYRSESGYYWYQLPVRTHVKMIEVFDEVANDADAVNALKVWLLKNKQTNHWKTTKATAAAVYAFLSTGADWLADTQPVKVIWKDKAVQQQTATAQANAEAGTGYFKTRIEGAQVSKSLGSITLENPNAGPAWGALYWQYFEDIDRIDSFEDTPLTLKRHLFKVRQGPTGETLEPLADGAALQVGDKVRARVELRVDRAMEYVHLKDARAAGFEPVNVLSQYKYQDGLGYYESTTDAATHFFISYLRPGNYVFEYTLNATLAGDFSHGVSSVQCMYAPEFSSHSEGMRVMIE